MSLDQLDLILCDVFEMDAWEPPLRFKWQKDFDKASYSRWAIDELKEYIAKKIYPKTDVSVRELCLITNEFTQKMARYSRANDRTRQIFQTASNVTADILDLFRAMS